MPADRPDLLGARVRALAVLASAALAAVLILRLREVELAVHLYLVVMAALAAALLVGRSLSGVRFADAPSVLHLPRRRRRPARPRPIEEMEHAVDFSRSRAFDVHFWLRPHLVRIAAHRLATHRGVSLEGQPAAARAALGERLWEIVRPGREVPDRAEPGLRVADLRRLVEDLERV